MKRFIAFILIICILAIATGCGGGEERQTPASWCVVSVIDEFSRNCEYKEIIGHKTEQIFDTIDLEGDLSLTGYRFIITVHYTIYIQGSEKANTKTYFASIIYKRDDINKLGNPTITESQIQDLDIVEYL